MATVATVRRRAVRALAWLAVLLVAATAVLGYRGLRVLWSIDDYAAYWDLRADADGELLYVALGDSLAQGLGADLPQRGYVGLLADDLEAATGRSVAVVNLSRSGARAADVVSEQLPALTALLDSGAEPALVTVDVGANDVGRTTTQDFAGELEQILDALPPGTLVADVPDFGGGPSWGQARELSAVVRDGVDDHPTLVQVDVEDATAEMGWGAWGGDWFHPSDAGYRLYRDAFRDASDLL